MELTLKFLALFCFFLSTCFIFCFQGAASLFFYVSFMSVRLQSVHKWLQVFDLLSFCLLLCVSNNLSFHVKILNLRSS